MEDNYNSEFIIERLKGLEKDNRKALVALELLKAFINKSNEEEIEARKENEALKIENKKIVETVISILDYIDNIYRFANSSGNSALISNLENSMTLIKDELNNIDLNEVPALGQLFDNKLHKCIQTQEQEGKLQYEILEVVKKGYSYKGEVIRPAAVIARK